MGYQTDFYGTLQFTRKLTAEELSTLDKIITAAWHSDDEVLEAVRRQAEATRVIEREGHGPLVFDPHEGANLRAGFQDLITGEGLSPHSARALRISDHKSGLVYCAEKTYDMVAGVNFIIANGRARIAGFGLKGSLFASTEFKPYHWLVKINDEGWAYQKKCHQRALWDHDKKAYLERLEAELNWRRKEANRAEDPRRAFRRAVDAACDRVDEFLDRGERRWQRLRYWIETRIIRPLL
jgi:hypothetical protein